MHSMGMSPNWAFSELFGFDEDLLAFIPRPVCAVILNAQYNQPRAERPQGSADTSVQYYMKQTRELDNACGVIAALHCVYNNQGAGKVDLVPDSTLATFISQVESATPADKATALESFSAFKEQYRQVAS